MNGRSTVASPNGSARLSLLVLILFSPISIRAEKNPKALEVIQAAVEAMGGEKYLQIKNYSSSGRYFRFDRRGRKAFTRFWDWTVYDPIKSRFQTGEKKRQYVRIHNLEIGKAWTLEGEDEVKEIPEEAIAQFRKAVKKDINILLKQRVTEEGVDLYYFGPDEIAGSGEHEAVEFLDEANLSIVVYFDRNTHLPAFLETPFVGAEGLRHEQRTEFYNWHTIQGVHTPLRSDSYVDDKISDQVFTEKITYNAAIPESHFLKPEVKKK